MLCDEYSSNTLKNYKPNTMETLSTQQNQAISLKGVPTSHKINLFKRKVNLALNVMTIGEELEGVTHALWSSPVVNETWYIS